MRDVYEVLREKEEAVERVDREIQVLRLAVPLLTDGTDIGLLPAAAPGVQGTADAQEVFHSRPPRAARTVTDDPERNGTDATDDVKLGAAKKISARLKRLATPLMNAGGLAS